MPAGYDALHSTSPDPVVAGEEARFTVQITDLLGCPVEDLQASHERMVHTVLISEDLSSFLHLHQEDFEPLDADDLRTATFSFPLTLPQSGRWKLAFDFAHRNQWLHDEGWLDAVGEPAPGTPDLQPRLEDEEGGVRGALRSEAALVVGEPAVLWLTLEEAEGGAPVTDLVQWLGADAHLALTPADRSVVDHTHAWVEGMDEMTPGMEMPQQWTGPELPFHVTFPSAGAWRLWAQFTRADAPQEPIVLDFTVDVG